MPYAVAITGDAMQISAEQVEGRWRRQSRVRRRVIRRSRAEKIVAPAAEQVAFRAGARRRGTVRYRRQDRRTRRADEDRQVSGELAFRPSLFSCLPSSRARKATEEQSGDGVYHTNPRQEGERRNRQCFARTRGEKAGGSMREQP